jgi:hypothetical protein
MRLFLKLIPMSAFFHTYVMFEKFKDLGGANWFTPISTADFIEFTTR